MRKASKKKAALEEAAEDQAALEEIATIRRNGFDPGDEMIKKLLLECRPTRALVVMQLAARADRLWWPYH
jgi:hypothetical protein